MILAVFIEVMTIVLAFVAFVAGYIWICHNQDRVGYMRGALIWVTHALVFSVVALLFLLELIDASYIVIAVWAGALVLHGVLLILSVFIILHLHASEKK